MKTSFKGSKLQIIIEFARWLEDLERDNWEQLDIVVEVLS